MARFDRHNEIELNLLDRGSLTYLLGGRRISIPPGRLAVFWAAVPHQIVNFAGVAPYRVMTIPLAWFLQWRLDERLVHPVVHGEVVLAPEADYPMDRLLCDAWLKDARSASAELRRVCLREVECRLRRLAMGLPRSGPEV